MLQIKLTLNINRDSELNEENDFTTVSDEEILSALSYVCKVQSSLSRDKIVSLYEQAGRITDCLVNYDIDDGSLLQPHSTSFCDTAGINASSSSPRCIINVH